MNSQSKLILNHLENGGSLTALEALRQFGCIRLAARIFDLKEKGYNIKSEMVTTKDQKKIARYFI